MSTRRHRRGHRARPAPPRARGGAPDTMDPIAWVVGPEGGLFSLVVAEPWYLLGDPILARAAFRFMVACKTRPMPCASCDNAHAGPVSPPLFAIIRRKRNEGRAAIAPICASCAIRPRAEIFDEVRCSLSTIRGTAMRPIDPASLSPNEGTA